MATLNSPGVQVSVINESFYVPAAPGTIPLIFVASASNKPNASATATAVGTLDSNAGQVWTITSQRDLTDTFGTPYFETDASNNPVNAGELNEYGLQAAYSLLGVSSQAYIVRADVDLSQLEPSTDAPNGLPVAGQYWVDTANTMYGISQWDSVNKVFTTVTPLIIDDSNKSIAADAAGEDYTPKTSFGSIGSYAMVVTSYNTNQLWYKNWSNNWVQVATNLETGFTSNGWTSNCWQTSIPVVVSTGLKSGLQSGASAFSINGHSITLSGITVDSIVSSINSIMYQYGVGARNVNGYLAIYADATASSTGSGQDGKVVIAGGTDTLDQLGLGAGPYGPLAIAIQPHTQVPRYASLGNPSGSLWIKTTAPSNGANWSVKYYNGATQTFGSVSAPLYPTSSAAIYTLDKAGGLNIPVGTLYVESNYDHGVSPITGVTTSSYATANFALYRRNSTGPTTISNSVASSFTFNSAGSSFTIAETVANNTGFYNTTTITLPASATLSQFVSAVSSATSLTNISANYNSSAGILTISHKLGGDFLLADGTNSPLTGAGAHSLSFSQYDLSAKTGTINLYAAGNFDGIFANNGSLNGLRASNWKPLSYEASTTPPYTTPADGQLWYNPSVTDVDILYNYNNTWVGYLTQFSQSNPTGPIVSATAPTTQSDGSQLVDGDIWVSTADMENYGKNIYVYNGTTSKWVLQDVTDHVTPNGWVFADARWATTGQASAPSKIVDLLSSNYVDPDAPDPALYPEGTRLWNTRRSGHNVKKYVSNYINIYANNGYNIRYPTDQMDGVTPYFTDRWVTASPNDDLGVGTFGRYSQRAVVVSRLKSLIDTNQAIRDTDTLVFNLIACPGYPEVIQNMIGLNTDRYQTAFVVGDTPFRLPADGTSLAAWGNNSNHALDNGDVGATSYDSYTAIYYPSGYTNDNLGNNIVVPPSHMMLRTIARSDSVSYPWFAPAGLRRGTVDNATSVGYVDKTTGEFVQASLYESLRDVMAQNGHINPIATLTGSGLTVMGEYTRANASSALDRVGVARLVCYLRRQLDLLSRPFLFEPNDKITRDELKAAAESLLVELVGQRALYDFIVVCDESNNTPARIDRNELWMDIAIEPVKAVEFIYIPLRLVNTGAIAAGRI